MIHSIVTDEAAFEELVELSKEVESIRLSTKYKSLVETKQVEAIGRVDMLSAMKIKGWLFNFYAFMQDKDSYDQINKMSLDYMHRLNHQCSASDIKFHSFLHSRQLDETLKCV